jgi:Thioester domain
MFRRGWRVAVVLVLALGALLLQVAPAGAVFRGRPPTPPPRVRSNTNTQLVLSSTGYGRGVTGFIANPSNPFDPVVDGYPASDPTTGFTPKDEGFAGIIHAHPPGGGAEESLYCIDINTDTYIGFGYVLGTWDAANVPNVGYVARLLNEYYPNTNEPAGLTDLGQKAAAVQAAIWFFSDRYVLNTSDALHGTVVAIVNRIRSEGPLVEPPPPSLTITPPQLSGPVGGVLGPFTVTTSSRRHAHRRLRGATQATVTATGGSMFSDAAGTVPISNGATVPSGQKI